MNHCTKYLAILVVLASVLVGCSDKSPPASEEALNSYGATKGGGFEQMKANSKAANPGAPGGPGK